MVTLPQAIELATKAHEGQWKRPKYLRQGPGELITDEQMSDMMYGSLVGEYLALPNKSMLTYCTNYKQWYTVEPYITHPLAVMNMMDTEEEKIVAVLHGLFKYTEAKLLHSTESGYSFIKIYKGEAYIIFENAYHALSLLTKQSNQTYLEYIKGIARNKLATKVKIVSMFHDMAYTDSQKQKDKHLEALPILLKGL
jgi:hypothetical protein